MVDVWSAPHSRSSDLVLGILISAIREAQCETNLDVACAVLCASGVYKVDNDWPEKRLEPLRTELCAAARPDSFIDRMPKIGLDKTDMCR